MILFKPNGQFSMLPRDWLIVERKLRSKMYASWRRVLDKRRTFQGVRYSETVNSGIIKIDHPPSVKALSKFKF